MAEEVVCYICHDEFARGSEIAEIDSCSHAFCFPCISKWSAIENTCPCCKLRFTTITKKALAASPATLAALPPGSRLPGNVLGVQRCEETNQRPVFEDPSFQEYIESVVCLVCGGNHDEDRLLLCDDCDAAAHTFCVGLDSIPEGDWFCSACSHRREEAERRRRRQLEERRQRAVARQQRKRRRTLIDSEEDGEEEEEEGVVIESEDDGDILEIVEVRRGGRSSGGRLQRAGSGGAGGRRRRGAADDDMADFIVPTDEEEDSDGSLELEEEEEEELDMRAAGRRRQQQQRGRGGRRGQRSDLEEEDEEEEWEEWGSDEEEERAVTLRQRQQRLRRQQRQEPARTAPNRDGEWRQVNRSGLNTRGTTRGSRLAAQAAAGPSRGRAASRQRDQRAAAAAATAPTAAHRAVQALSDNWASIRSGRASFDEVLLSSGGGGGGGGGDGGAPQRRQRSALERVRASETEVIDLSVSPADATAAAQRGNGGGRVPLSPPVLSLSAHLRAQIQDCRDRGSRLPPSRGGPPSFGPGAAARPAPAVTPRPAAGAPGASPWRSTTSPGSTGPRMRTVKDLQRGAEIARGTPASGSRPSSAAAAGAAWPGSSGQRRTSDPFRPPRPAAARALNDSRSSPPPLQERLAARTALEWGQPRPNERGSGSGSGGSGAVLTTAFQQQQQQQAQARPAPQPGPWKQAHRPGRLPQPLPQAAPQAAPPTVPMPTRTDIPVFMRRQMVAAGGSGGGGPSAQQQSRRPDSQQSPAYSPPKPNLGNSGGSGGSAATHAPAPAPTAAPAGGPNPKEAAYERVRGHLEPMWQEGDISKAQYKAIARDASRALYRRHGSGVGEAPEHEVARIVDEALVAAIRAGTGGAG